MPARTGGTCRGTRIAARRTPCSSLTERDMRRNRDRRCEMPCRTRRLRSPHESLQARIRRCWAVVERRELATFSIPRGHRRYERRWTNFSPQDDAVPDAAISSTRFTTPFLGVGEKREYRSIASSWQFISARTRSSRRASSPDDLAASLGDADALGESLRDDLFGVASMSWYLSDELRC